MSMHFDVIVAGLGAMGSATLMQLAERGKRVLGLEKFDLGHGMGSSHGRTRLFRLAYFEGSAYVPMLRRALELWQDTGKRAGKTLLHRSGSLDIAPQGSGVVESALQSCLNNDLAYETFDAVGLRKRFPAFRLDPEHIALFQPDGGFLECENAMQAQIGLARASGAEIRVNCPLLEFDTTSDGGVRVRTPEGDFTAGSLVLSVGAWIGKTLPAHARLFRPVRQTIAFLKPLDRQHLTPDRLPGFTLLADGGHYYGLPIHDHPGIKIGGPHLSRLAIDPDLDDRKHNAEQLSKIRAFASRYIPDAAGEPLVLGGCMYTWVEDEHFVIDHLPGAKQVIIASPCSGHGFKFSSVIGEILADLSTTGEAGFDLSMFRLDRPALALTA